MPGILQRLGSAGLGYIRKAQALGRSLGETIGLLKPVEPEIEPMAAARDMGRVSTLDALTPEVLKVRADEFVPRDLFVRSDLPWADKYAYQIAVFGRDRSTGRFRRQVYDMTVSKEMTVDEIKETAKLTFGRCTRAHFSEFFDIAITGAWKSPEVEW